jgi:hypothetical protein
MSFTRTRTRSHTRTRAQPRAHKTFAQLGEHAGFAIYKPRDRRDLKQQLFGAIGQTIDFNFAGIAGEDEPFAGQNLYQECGATSILQSSWIPEQDLEFLAPAIGTGRPNPVK